MTAYSVLPALAFFIAAGIILAVILIGMKIERCGIKKFMTDPKYSLLDIIIILFWANVICPIFWEIIRRIW